jgi:hypothetical protein
MMSKLPMLLNRLEHVRQTSTGRYRAKCPVHGGDSRSSLGIKECDDGIILLKCYAHECPPLEIVNVCGLEMSDLFPERLTHHATPRDVLKWKQDAQHKDWREARNNIELETLVVMLAAEEAGAGRPLDKTDKNRLRLAYRRLLTEGRILNES